MVRLLPAAAGEYVAIPSSFFVIWGRRIRRVFDHCGYVIPLVGHLDVDLLRDPR